MNNIFLEKARDSIYVLKFLVEHRLLTSEQAENDLLWASLVSTSRRYESELEYIAHNLYPATSTEFQKKFKQKFENVLFLFSVGLSAFVDLSDIPEDNEFDQNETSRVVDFFKTQSHSLVIDKLKKSVLNRTAFVLYLASRLETFSELWQHFPDLTPSEFCGIASEFSEISLDSLVGHKAYLKNPTLVQEIVQWLLSEADSKKHLESEVDVAHISAVMAPFSLQTTEKAENTFLELCQETSEISDILAVLIEGAVQSEALSFNMAAKLLTRNFESDNSKQIVAKAVLHAECRKASDDTPFEKAVKALSHILPSVSHWLDMQEVLTVSAEEFAKAVVSVYNSKEAGENRNAWLARVTLFFGPKTYKIVWTSEYLKALWVAFKENGATAAEIQASLQEIYENAPFSGSAYITNTKTGRLIGTRLAIKALQQTSYIEPTFETHGYEKSRKLVSKINAFISTLEGPAAAHLQWLQRNVFASIISQETLFGTMEGLEDPTPVIEAAIEKALAIKGSFDAAKYLDIGFLMSYFAQRKSKKKLFSAKFDWTYGDRADIVGLENNSPFEKGFSWARFEKICALAKISTFTTAQSGYSKYLASLICRFTEEAPEVLDARISSHSPVKGVKGVIKKAYDFLAKREHWYGSQGYGKFLKEFPLTSRMLKHQAEIKQLFAKHPEALSNILYVLMYVNAFDRVPAHPVLLKYIRDCYYVSKRFTKLEVFSKHEQYLVLSLSRKVSFETITRAISYAERNTGKKENKIPLVPVLLPEESLSVKLLEPGDLRALSIGEETNCCQYIEGHASSCAAATYNNEAYAVMVVEATNGKLSEKPIAQSALWISDNTVVIDSIEGLRKDGQSYNKIAQAYSKAIDQWHEQGLRVVIAETSYGLTNQIRRKFAGMLKYSVKRATRPPLVLKNCYTDTDSDVFQIGVKAD